MDTNNLPKNFKKIHSIQVATATMPDGTKRDAYIVRYYSSKSGNIYDYEGLQSDPIIANLLQMAGEMKIRRVS